MAKQNRKTIARDAIDWYLRNKNLYEKLSLKTESIVREIIDEKGIAIHGVSSRTKEIDSFREKIINGKYKDPKTEVTDLSGIRVITYVESDVKKVCDIVEEVFEIDKPNSIDKRKVLGTDKVGYMSIHYVAHLKKKD